MKTVYAIDTPCLRDAGAVRRCYLYSLSDGGIDILASNGCEDCSGSPLCADCGIRIRKAYAVRISPGNADLFAAFPPLPPLNAKRNPPLPFPSLQKARFFAPALPLHHPIPPPPAAGPETSIN